MATKSVKTTKSGQPHPMFQGKYIEGLGSRKRATARVRLYEDNKDHEKVMVVNDTPVDAYFPTEEMRLIAKDALNKVKAHTMFHVSAHIEGGGIHAQAEAMRHGIARALVKVNEESRKKLKKSGFLKRDPREKERRKFGLKKARKAPQWSKR